MDRTNQKLAKLAALLPSLLSEGVLNVKLAVEHEAADPELVFDWSHNENGADYRVFLRVESLKSEHGFVAKLHRVDDSDKLSKTYGYFEGSVAEILEVVTDPNVDSEWVDEE